MKKLNVAVGHATCKEIRSGLTVFLLPQLSACGYWLCGSAPATRDVALLDAANTVEGINALVFTGGSAFGLDAAAGVMRWLKEQGQGFPSLAGPVPIVPTAAIFDLSEGQATAPSSDDAYAACGNAIVENKASGNIGAGTGATIGKLTSAGKLAAGGLGYAEMICENGLQVLVYAVVNCVGDVMNEHGNIIAGSTTANGFLNLQKHFMSGISTQTDLLTQSNTTLVAVFTNAKFNKAQLTRIAKTACAGMARAINPCFTAYDGDIVFAVSQGELMADEVSVGIIAAELTRQAIVNAVTA